MQQKLKKYTVQHWADTFMKDLETMRKDSSGYSDTPLLDGSIKTELLQSYKKAKKRLLLLDYDGTLMPFFPTPEQAAPDQELLSLLTRLKQEKGNELVIISGRDHQTLGEWLGALELEMSAEHGVRRYINNKWSVLPGLTNSWKKDIYPLLESLVERTPGSFIEEKEYSIAWHYRQIDKELGERRVREFRDVLRYLTGNLDLQVLEGHKVVEIKNAGVNKGKAVLHWLDQVNYDFILAIGDDHTDEDTFKALPPKAYTLKVGHQPTAARFKILGPEKVRGLLGDLIGSVA